MKAAPSAALEQLLAQHDDNRGTIRSWLRNLRSTFLAYGADVAHDLEGTDNVQRAEKALHLLEKGKWIERGANPTLDYRRTKEIAFFGVGGQSGRDALRSPSPSGVLFGYAPAAALLTVSLEPMT